MSTEPRDLGALFRECAAGRREYAKNAPDDTRALLEVEANTLEMAARVADGDESPLYSWLPSWRWTEGMTEALYRREVTDGPR